MTGRMVDVGARFGLGAAIASLAALVAVASPWLALATCVLGAAVWLVVRDSSGHAASLAAALVVAAPGFETLLGALSPVGLRYVAPLPLLLILVAVAARVVRLGVPRSRLVAVGALGIVAVALVAWSGSVPYRYYGLDKGWATVMFVLLPVAAVLLLDRIHTRTLRGALVAVAAPVACFALVGPHVPLGALGAELGSFQVDNSVWFGRTIALGAVACLGAAGSRLTPAKASVFALLVGALVVSGKQGPALGVAAAAAVWWLARRPRPSLVLLVALAASTVLTCLAIWLPGATPAGVYAQVDSDGNATVRRAMFAEAWHEFTQEPLVGVGYGNYQGLDRGAPAQYPHDVVLELLAETGILGLAAVAGLAVAGLRRASSDLAPLVACAFAFALVSGGIPENVEWPVLLALAVAVVPAVPAVRRSVAA